MAFKKILDFLKGKSLLEDAQQDIQKMFDETGRMFKEVNELLFERVEIDLNLYDIDKAVNKKEIEIRRKILEHLVFSRDKNDIVAALVMTGLVIDLERIGDYCKNIFELVKFYPEQLEQNSVIQTLKEKASLIEQEFEDTRLSLREADKERAQKVLKIHGDVSKTCDSLIEEILKDDTKDKKMSVISVLLARYLKRVSAHLWNMASSVINPFPRIGYHPDSKF